MYLMKLVSTDSEKIRKVAVKFGARSCFETKEAFHRQHS